MEWDKLTLDKLGSVSRGRSKHRPRNDESLFNGIYPFIQTGDVKSAGLHIVDYSETYNEKGLAQSKLWAPGTLCITIAANIADTSILSFPACFPDSIIGFIADESKSDVRFVKYSFDILQKKCQAISLGATQDNLSWEKLSKIKFDVPELPIQRRIASILSAYDNLIENNNKRIRLLEQMAENLYKEWFVRFRFPGHENAEFENGLPKGWSRSSLAEICEFKRGKNITSDEMREGIIPVISAGIDVSGYHNEANVNGISVTMSSSGANAGYISIHYTSIWAADCSYIEESTTDNIYYAYELLNNMRVVITNFQRGAAQPHVYPKDINRIKLIVPNKELMAEANKRLAVIHQEIHHLQQQSNLLSRQRDLLLPRLMSGKLEVNV